MSPGLDVSDVWVLAMLHVGQDVFAILSLLVLVAFLVTLIAAAPSSARVFA